MNKICVASCVASLLSLGSGLAHAGKPLSICDDGAGWPPYTYQDPVKPEQVVGASKELVFSILQRAGFSPHITLLPWKRCLAQVQSGQTDMLLNAAYSEERASNYHLTEPYYSLHSVLFYATNKFPSPPNLATIADMRAYRYCGLFGYNYTMYEIPPAQLDTGAKDEPSRFAMLARDRCDFVLGDVEILKAFAAMGKVDLTGTAHIAIPGDKPKQFHAMVSRQRKDGEKLVKILNDGFIALKADHTFGKIFKRYGLEEQ